MLIFPISLGCFGEIIPVFRCVYYRPHLSRPPKPFCRVHGNRHLFPLLCMSASRWDELCPSTTFFPSLTVVGAQMSVIHIPLRRLSAFIWVASLSGPVKVVLLRRCVSMLKQCHRLIFCNLSFNFFSFPCLMDAIDSYFCYLSTMKALWYDNK